MITFSVSSPPLLILSSLHYSLILALCVLSLITGSRVVIRRSIRRIYPFLVNFLFSTRFSSFSNIFYFAIFSLNFVFLIISS